MSKWAARKFTPPSEGTGLKWGVYELDDGTLHVRPLDDDREHEWADCWCRPFLSEGHDNIHVHNSMDKRELIERGEAAVQ